MNSTLTQTIVPAMYSHYTFRQVIIEWMLAIFVVFEYASLTQNIDCKTYTISHLMVALYHWTLCEPIISCALTVLLLIFHHKAKTHVIILLDCHGWIRAITCWKLSSFLYFVSSFATRVYTQWSDDAKRRKDQQFRAIISMFNLVRLFVCAYSCVREWFVEIKK